MELLTLYTASSSNQHLPNLGEGGELGEGVQAIHDVCRGTYIVILGETEELANLRGALGTKTLGVHNVGDTWDIIFALLNDGKSKNREIHSNDAATDRLALTLTSATRAVAGVAVGEKESDTSGMHNTLLHWETLLVVAAGDLEDVAFELITNAIAWNLGAHSDDLVRNRPGVFHSSRARTSYP